MPRGTVRAKGLNVSWLATVVAHLNEVRSLTWKTFVLVHWLSVNFGAAWGMKAGAEAVLCVVDFALYEVILITILFLSKDNLGEGLVNFSSHGVTPFVGADIEGRLRDSAFEGLGKDSVGGEGVLTADRVELALAFP